MGWPQIGVVKIQTFDKKVAFKNCFLVPNVWKAVSGRMGTSHWEVGFKIANVNHEGEGSQFINNMNSSVTFQLYLNSTEFKSNIRWLQPTI